MNLLKLCRKCGKTSSEVRFPPLSKHRCVPCSDAAKAERAARLDERGTRLSARTPDPADNPKHLAWIRSLPCAVHRIQCSRIMHAHHVRSAETAGVGMKPPPESAAPLCATHHMEGHQKGWTTFELEYGVDLRSLAIGLARRSPHIKKPANV